MKLGRREVVTGLGAAAAVLALPSAGRAATAPTVHWVEQLSGDRARIRMEVSTTTPIAAIKAHVRTADGTEVALVTDFVFHIGTPLRGQWECAARIQLAELGDYQVDVEVTSEDGGHVLVEDAMTLEYWGTGTIRGLKTTPGSIQVTAPTVTLSGTAVVVHPGTWAETPLPGRQLDIVVEYPEDGPAADFALTAVTDAQGAFSVPLTLAQAANIKATVPPQQYLLGHTMTTSVWVAARWPQLELTLREEAVLPGASTELRGRLRCDLGAGMEPLAGRNVSVTWDDNDATPVRAGGFVTDAQGEFSATVVPPTGRHSCWARFRSDDPFIGSTSDYLYVATVYPVQVDEFQVVDAGGGSRRVLG